MFRKEESGFDRRQYIRLDSVFPVQFQLVRPDSQDSLSDWLQGFTNNISRGGICLEVNNLNPAFARLLEEKQVKLSLGIEMPFSKNPIPALAQVVWIKEVDASLHRYLIGLNYENIPAAGNERIVRYARAKQLFFPIVLSTILILGLGFAVNSYINIKLVQGNRALVEQLISILQDSAVTKQKIKEIGKEREDLQVRIQALQLRIKTVDEDKARLSEKTKMEEASVAQKIKELSGLITTLTQEKEAVEAELISVQHRENTMTEELLRLDKRKADLEKANLDKMFTWLKRRQNPRTGLILSVEGDATAGSRGFVYDQALMLQADVICSDLEQAKRMLEFFDKRARRKEGLFFTAYRVNDGSPATDVVSSGPNVWLGIAILHYSKKTQDQTYLPLAEEIAAGIMKLQDNEGGIRGGPDVGWYLAEHTLDAFAFFNMLYRITGKSAYLQTRDKLLSWFVAHPYDKIATPLTLAEGEASVPTDVFVEAIAAIGPQKLEEVGMSSDRIIEAAEQRFGAEVSYARPDSQLIRIQGFDYAPAKHAKQGGVVSPEFTAQMVIAYKSLADFYYTKGMIAKYRSYLVKVDNYLAQLSNMVISNPSPSGQGESCLPFATQDNVDTGHGWVASAAQVSGSVPSTVYTLFAYYNYNPLELK